MKNARSSTPNDDRKAAAGHVDWVGAFTVKEAL
jgi:hypothetical protein